MTKKLIFKINYNIINSDEFCNEKIVFLHPKGNSVDMEYSYRTKYNKLIPCNCIFNGDEVDLELEFNNTNKDYDIEDIKNDVLMSIEDYNCELIN